MKTQIQLTIGQLEMIIAEAKKKRANCNALSDTLVITKKQECDTHCGSDVVSVELSSNYAECFSTTIYENN